MRMDSNFQTPIKSKLPSKIKSSSLTIPPSPLMEKLGYGTGITVFRMNRPVVNEVNNSPWAVKTLNKGLNNKNILKTVKSRLRSEAAFLRKLNHPNIVGFRATTKMEDGRMCLLLEDCKISLGDLIEQRNEDFGGTFETLYIKKMIHDVSNGLNYLHTAAKLLHCDIKSHNILIKNDFEICKICDFGTTLPLNENGELDEGKAKRKEYVGTPCWSAKEVLKEPPIITSKADIFSFGLVIWEMLTLNVPHATFAASDSFDSSTNEDQEPPDMFEVYGTRPEVPDVPTDEYGDILAIFYACTELDYKKRPSAQVIFNIVQTISDKAEN